MISALAGLPSLGGIGGGFDGGSLPLLGFGLLSTFANTLTTQSFQGPTTNIPDLSSQANINFGNASSNFNTNFGSYTGNGQNVNGYYWNPYPYGDNPSLHTGASDFRSWHQWATGGVQPPLAVAPFYGQSYGYSNVQFGSAGAYGAAGYGSAGGYGAVGGYGAAQGGAFPYSASPAYCPPTQAPAYGGQPIFSNAYQAMGTVQQSNYTAVPNYTPIQTNIPPTQYTPPTYNYNTPPVQTPTYTPATYTPPDYSNPGVANPYYGQPTPEQTANFNNYAQQALSQFNATGASISGQYSSATGMTAPSYQPATYGTGTYGGQPTPEQTANFNNYAQQALAQLNATSASIQGTYQSSFTSTTSTYGRSDITYTLPSSPQVPSYAGYTNSYQSLPTYGSASYGAYNSVAWSYPQQQTPVFYGSALPSYTAPLIQQQTPYCYGGPPQPAPCPAPTYPPRPPHHHHDHDYGQPTTPPTPPTPPTTPDYSTPPVVQAPPPPKVSEIEQFTPVASTNFTRPGRVEYGQVPIIQQDVAGPASVLASRMTGDPNKIASFATSTPAPGQNNDAMRYDRLGAYAVMQQDSSLRYNVDTGRFFRTYDGGVTKDVLDMAQVSQMMRQDHPDNFARVGQLLQHLPTDNQLFGSKEPSAPTSPNNSATGAVNLPPLNMPTLPPLNTPTLPPFAGFGNSGGKVPALDALIAQREAGQISGNDFNLALLQIASQQGALNPNPQPQAPGFPFQITAHRYWDPQRGDYANVTDVTTQGTEGADQRVFNPQNQTSVTVTRNDVPPGTPVRVTINWDNGQSRVWDYQVAATDQADVDVFSPIG